jgi:preprotein translocase subunit YajC
MNLQSLILPLLIVLLAVPLFLQARKQKRAMAEQQKLQNSITVGDRVMTTSGVFGTVVATNDDSIDLELAPGLITTWVRQAVREKVETESAAAEETTEPAEDAAAEESTEVKAEEQKTS